MSSKHKFNIRNKRGLKLGLYGKLTYNAVAYCKKHKCYLQPVDIKNKRCNWKECKYLSDTII